MTKRYLKFLRNGLDVTEGKLYEIEGEDSGDYQFTDDANEEHYWGKSEEGIAFSVVEEDEMETLRPTRGDRIRIVNSELTGGEYQNGDILTVRGNYGNIGVLVNEFEQPFIHHDEYEVVREDTIELGEGDIVRVEVEGDPRGGWGSAENGDIGVVRDVVPYGVFVDFPRHKFWTAEKSELVLVAKAGDRKDKGRE
jgi:hypothetical protein